jgi:hypothetical protein
MRAVARRYPDDLDVQTLYAESIMNVHAWKLWSFAQRGGRPRFPSARQRSEAANLPFVTGSFGSVTGN